MNFKNLLILLATSLLWISCSDDDSEDGNMNPTGGNNNIEYIDQDLQGQIDGESWTYGDGVATSTSTSGDSALTFFSIGVETQDTSFCFFDNPNNESYLLFSYSHPGNVVPTFSKELSFDFLSGDAYTITMVSFSDTSSFPFNRIISSGGLEITEVDTVAKTITGRMDIQDEAEGAANNVNGNFTIRYCRF